MDTVTVVLTLLLAVVVSGSLARMSPFPLPLPLVQILLGALLSVVGNLGVELKPDIFFLLFLPPLLFLDGWRIPKDDLFRDKNVILELALGLVVFTVLGLGFFMDWLILGCRLPSPSRWLLSFRPQIQSPFQLSQRVFRFPFA